MIGLAGSKPTKVWCHCYGTAEPTGAWRYPDSDHAYTCGMRWLMETAVDSVQAGRWLGSPAATR